MSKKIEICFIEYKVDDNVASYRIWVKDLAAYFNELGFRVYINELPRNINSNLVFILGKSDARKCEDYKKSYPNNLIGIINPEGGLVSSADFIIVGSIEEKDSLAMNKNVFVFPLIERMYSNVTPKIHTDDKKIIIGVHGNYTHLSKFNPHLKNALEEFSKDKDIVLKIISDKNAKNWSHGKPKIPNIKFLDWDFEKNIKNLSSCDIGLVPNISDNTPLFKKISKDKGLYNSDYFFRMKNKSNSGRMFVFIQHGIPVIADLTPSNLHILGNPENGYAVFSKDGWLKALKELSKAKKRNTISRNALIEFNRLYNPLEWVSKLANNIQQIEKYDNSN
jgi:glycosyltransferase involved in cell wall biosynthesis|tara:strand:- start:1848 stop:2852 length:1005 start_codon:yes stop_codon:yes gene_type:complete